MQFFYRDERSAVILSLETQDDGLLPPSKRFKAQCCCLSSSFFSRCVYCGRLRFNRDFTARFGQLFSQYKQITLLEPPISLPPCPIYLYWHARNQNNPVHQWVKGIIKEVSGK